MTQTSEERREELERMAWAQNWQPCELKHALDSGGATYADECVLPMPNGREVRCPAFPEECAYVRVVEGGHELAFWSVTEIAEDAADVVGAIFGCAAGGQAAQAPTTRNTTLPAEITELLLQARAAFGFLSMGASTPADRAEFKRRELRAEEMLGRHTGSARSA